MRRRALVIGTLVATASLGFVAERDASACGGCFAPPNESNSVVTDHRMILTVSPVQTTLYDQIHYAGSPSSFAWVLPINGSATVGLSADVLFGSLDAMSQSQVVQPATNCPPPPNCAFGASAGTAGPSAADGGAPGDVTVTKQEQVGPYETVQLHSTDPQALNTWLTSHNFNIPADVQPIIAQYVTEHFDFLAMKLVPGQSVQSMRPVRVTTPGASPILPLRMVAAGTGATTGITLWVVGDGRYEPQNFPFFNIKDDELVWDWATNSSNFKTLRAAKEAAFNGAGWEMESSLDLNEDLVRQVVDNGGIYYGNGNGGGPPIQADAGADYLGTDAGADGGGGATPTDARDADLATLFTGIAGPSFRLTRIRTDIARAALATDLSLQASADQSVLPNVHNVTHEANQPQCPIYDQSCGVIGYGPRDQVTANGNGSGSGSAGSFNCATAPQPLGGRLALGAVTMMLGLAAIRARRRKNAAR